MGSIAAGGGHTAGRSLPVSAAGWRRIVGDGDTDWIDARIERARRMPSEPFAGVGDALGKLRAKSASDDEITDLGRGMQAARLFDLCRLLENPGDREADVGSVT